MKPVKKKKLCFHPSGLKLTVLEKILLKIILTVPKAAQRVTQEGEQKKVQHIA